MAYKISVEAKNDLESIWLYTFENWSLQQADRYIKLIFDEIDYLALNPDSGRDYSHVRKYYRSSKVKSHVIFYRQNPKNPDIEIVRVLHQRMDFETRISG
jgi:toxin ParE1/3/4